MILICWKEAILSWLLVKGSCFKKSYTMLSKNEHEYNLRLQWFWGSSELYLQTVNFDESYSLGYCSEGYGLLTEHHCYRIQEAVAKTEIVLVKYVIFKCKSWKCHVSTLIVFFLSSITDKNLLNSFFIDNLYLFISKVKIQNPKRRKKKKNKTKTKTKRKEKKGV